MRITDRQGNDIPAPTFPGWRALGNDEPICAGDCWVRTNGSDGFQTPGNIHCFIQFGTSSVGQTRASLGDATWWLIYRRDQWVDITDTQLYTIPGDRIVFGNQHPSLALVDGYLDTCLIARMGKVRDRKHRAWRRLGTPSPTLPSNPRRRSSIGNLKYRQPLPLP